MMDQGLERLIDEAGRDKVFARARSLGWHDVNSPPKWVWHIIAAEVMAGIPAQSAAPPPSLAKQILGFDLW